MYPNRKKIQGSPIPRPHGRGFKLGSLKGAVLITSNYDQLEMEGVSIYRKPINELDAFNKVRSFFKMNGFTENLIMRQNVKIEDTIIESFSGYHKDDIKCLMKTQGEFWGEIAKASFLCGHVEEVNTEEFFRNFPGSDPLKPLSVISVKKIENNFAVLSDMDTDLIAKKIDGSWKYIMSYGGVIPFCSETRKYAVPTTIGTYRIYCEEDED